MKKIKEFISYFMKKNSEGSSELASAYLGYYLLLSFIPLLMFMGQVIVYVVPNFSEILYDLTRQLPNDIENLINPVIENLISSQSSSLSIIAIGSALFAGSKGFLGLKKSLNQIFEVESKSKIPFFDIIFSVLYTIVFIIFLAVILLFSVFNDKIINMIKGLTTNIQIIDVISGILLDGLGMLMPFLLAILIFIFFYRYAPSFTKENRITFVEAFIGAVVATIGIALVTFFYRFTNDVLTSSPSIYGSLGSILLALVWLMTICQMIVLGAIFTKTYIEVIESR